MYEWHFNIVIFFPLGPGNLISFSQTFVCTGNFVQYPMLFRVSLIDKASNLLTAIKQFTSCDLALYVSTQYKIIDGCEISCYINLYIINGGLKSYGLMLEINKHLSHDF